MDNNNKITKQYYIPTLRELLIAIIDSKEIYSVKDNEITGTFKAVDILSSLYGFLIINNIASGFNINLDNYRLKYGQ